MQIMCFAIFFNMLLCSFFYIQLVLNPHESTVCYGPHAHSVTHHCRACCSPQSG